MKVLVAGVGDFPEPYETEDEQADGIARFAPLPALTEPVREMASALERAGATASRELLLESDATELLQRWKELRRTAGPGETLVLHFAGHGVQARSGGLYLAASGGQACDELLSDTCVSFGQLLETAENSGRPVLFLLDVCAAGQALVQQHLIDLAARRRQDAPRNVWIIGACTSDAITYGARFTVAAAHVLQQLADGDLDITPTLRYVPVETLATAVDRHLARTDRAAGRARQTIVRTAHVQADAEPQPFFRNPAHSRTPHRDLLAGMDPRLREFALGCSPDLDPLHFATRAAGTPTANDILFSGRRSQLDRIHEWVGNAGQGGLLVVTGGPGSGKSALLGVTACVLHPELEALGDRIARVVEYFDPRQPEIVLAVHARQLTLQQITDSLRHQLRQQRGSGRARTRQETPPSDVRPLLDELRAAGDVLVLLDALDEAADPAAVLDDLLLPLEAAGGGCRVMVGTRKWWDSLPALEQHLAEHPDAELDLDPVTPHDRGVLADDLETYLCRLLPRRRFPRDEVRRTADRLAQYSDHGAFLVASLYANHLLTTPHPAHAAPPCSITEVFDLHVNTLADREPWMRTVLNVLGQARGQGMPLDLIHAAALAQHPADGPQSARPLADTRRALAKAAFYLRTTPEDDQCLLYRYFHQALTDHTKGRTDLTALHRALIAAIPTGDDNTPDWDRAHPYLLRHAAEHAAACDELAGLLDDPSFLLHVSPDDLKRHLNKATDPRSARIATIYRSHTTHHRHRHELGARRSLLALDAAAWREPSLAEALGNLPVDRRVTSAVARWATNSQGSSARLHTLAGHTDSVTHVVTTHVWAANGEQLEVAITAGADGAAIIWNLDTGEEIHALRQHPGEITALAVAQYGRRSFAVTASKDTATVWDLGTGQRMHRLVGHKGVVTALAVAELDGRPAVITGSEDKTARSWDLLTGSHLLTFPDPQAPPEGSSRKESTDTEGKAEKEKPKIHSKKINAIAVAGNGGDPHVVTVGADGNAIVWSMSSGKALHLLRHGSTAVTSVIVVTMMGREHAVTASEGKHVGAYDVKTGKASGSWNSVAGRAGVLAGLDRGEELFIATADDRVVNVLRSGRPPLALKGHVGPVTDVALAEVSARPVAITTSVDQTAIMWDLNTGNYIRQFAGHTKRLTTVAVPESTGKPVAVTVCHDGTGVVWDLAVQDQQVFTAHTKRVNAVAAGDVDGRAVALTTSDDKTAILWDLATARRLHTFTTQSSSIHGAALANTPEQSLAITADGDGSIVFWDAVTGAQLRSARRHTGLVVAVCAGRLRSRSIALTASRDKSAALWDVVSGRFLRSLHGHTRPLTSCALTFMEGRRPLAMTGSEDKTAIVWDPLSGERIRTLAGHRDWVTGVVFAHARDRTLALTTSDDTTVRVWDPLTGEYLQELTAHGHWVNGATVVQVGGRSRVITVSTDNTAAIWATEDRLILEEVLHLPDEGIAVAGTGEFGVLVCGREVICYAWKSPGHPRDL
ncbi:caspase family protein [Streptomyces caeruleatus]|uniref:AAA+ ATPase domain-containing protein n=1 Tax=Streptomyces caeruleatus TaxID=661399 RepID=A0A117RPR1_9ACTN|nr:caspase family protein [Streptomyces caeruleatus]KUO02492.1 hypothetical protein AQJ67_21905 [Streptomyces caeruleatus]